MALSTSRTAYKIQVPPFHYYDIRKDWPDDSSYFDNVTVLCSWHDLL